MKKGNLLRISMMQSHIIWEDIEENISYYGELLRRVKGKADVAVLPELFTTGLSLRPRDLAQPVSGTTVTALKNYSAEYDIAVTGSFMASDNGKYYNRAFFITPDGKEYYYDKRHLFGMAGEDKCFSHGDKRLIVEYLDWKICLMVCYDLRFPVWSRNVDNEYDLLIYVANWAESRKKVWKTLLQARAIENMCFVCGVNRIGVDAREFSYHGGSLIYSPKGKKLYDAGEKDAVTLTGTINRDDLEALRAKFPAWQDADKFIING
ncbi:MAG: nitrilase family protein [Tannerella sp.]|jgi:predicted amidohydrolase|nr:nitrilase family protein [Tannerella sp.]